MCAGEDAQTHCIDVFVDRDTHDVIRTFAQTGVYDISAGIAQRQGNDFRADVVAIKAGFGDQNPFSL